MKKTIEFDEKCKACNGTGLYKGMGERDGFAVVCRKCNGSGCFHFKHEYEDFTERTTRAGIEQVLEINPGICAGVGKEGQYNYKDFGGMPYKDWVEGKPFIPGMEMRQFTCPAWWYQTADYKKKPEWGECTIGGAFSSCPYFDNKEACWERWDTLNPEK